MKERWATSEGALGCSTAMLPTPWLCYQLNPWSVWCSCPVEPMNILTVIVPFSWMHRTVLPLDSAEPAGRIVLGELHLSNQLLRTWQEWYFVESISLSVSHRCGAPRFPFLVQYLDCSCFSALPPWSSSIPTSACLFSISHSPELARASPACHSCIQFMRCLSPCATGLYGNTAPGTVGNFMRLVRSGALEQTTFSKASKLVCREGRVHSSIDGAFFLVDNDIGTGKLWVLCGTNSTVCMLGLQPFAPSPLTSVLLLCWWLSTKVCATL